MFNIHVLILLLGLTWIPFHEIKAAFFLSVPETLKLLRGELTKGEMNKNNNNNNSLSHWRQQFDYWTDEQRLYSLA